MHVLPLACGSLYVDSAFAREIPRPAKKSGFLPAVGMTSMAVQPRLAKKSAGRENSCELSAAVVKLSWSVLREIPRPAKKSAGSRDDAGLGMS
jgi:hypothetical protein